MIIKQIFRQLLGVVTLSFCLCLATISLHAQQKSEAQPCRPIAPEDTSNTSPEIRAMPYCFPSQPVSCETALFYLDDIGSKIRQNKYELIIVIGRIGKGEKSAIYNQRRLRLAKVYLGRLTKDVKIVTATGDRAKGNAQLEFYVKGELINVLSFTRNDVALRGAWLNGAQCRTNHV
jgi:hypothetical protein